MPRNPYFSLGTHSEKTLYEDIIIEGLRIYGQDVYYLPRNIINKDGIFNEASLSEFGQAFSIEMYVENVDGFEGEGDILSKFGLEMRDQMTLVVANRRWEQLIGRFDANASVRPHEGDLVYFPLVKGLFEIRYVQEESPFYQIQNVPVFKLKCELFEYSNEAIDTGVAEIDQIETLFASRVTITIGTGTGLFDIGENVSQDINGITVNGEIAEIRGNQIDLVGISASDGSNTSFSISSDTIGNLIGESSGASFEILSEDDFIPMDDRSEFTDNEEFEVIGNDFVDFTESNPFGIPDTL